MNTLATLHRLRQQLGFAATDTAEDARLLTVLQSATAWLERYTGRRFTPYSATIPHNVNPDAPTELLLSEDLLTLTSLTNGDGALIPTNNSVLQAGGRITLTNGATFTYNSTPLQVIQVAGLWGYHEDWARAWLQSADTVQNNPLSSTATTLTVTDADGADGFSQTPRFQVGQLLRIASEYVRVLAVNTTTNTLTLQRGVNGTTAASHAQNTVIEIYQPPAEVVMLCLRLAMWLYREPDTVNSDGKLPPLLLSALNPLRRVRV
jgi:hypothetical protein